MTFLPGPQKGLGESAVPGNPVGILAWDEGGANCLEALQRLCQQKQGRQPLPTGLGNWNSEAKWIEGL